MVRAGVDEAAKNQNNPGETPHSRKALDCMGVNRDGWWWRKGAACSGSSSHKPFIHSFQFHFAKSKLLRAPVKSRFFDNFRKYPPVVRVYPASAQCNTVLGVF